MASIAIILAAGLGTRMNSKHPKALQEIAGKHMIEHVLEMAEAVGFDKTVAVVGHEKEKVMIALDGRGISFAHQDERLGTGHAVMMAKDEMDPDASIIILNCDTPLLTEKLIEDFLAYHEEGRFDASILTAHVVNPFGYGRILRSQNGTVSRIVEQKDASEEEKAINEINSGIYVFKGSHLIESLGKLTNDNAQKEYYLTDCIQHIREAGGHIGAFAADDADEIAGINNKLQLADAEAVLRRRTNRKHMLAGVTIVNPDNAYIDSKALIGKDTIIYPGTVLKGRVVIGEDCIIGPNATIESSTIGNGVSIQNSTVLESRIDDGTAVGPYAYVRPKSVIGKHVKVGDFVEVKNATIGDNSKVSHLAYIGDGDVGSDVNIGCGVVFVNYNGRDKFRTVVEDGAFVGCNANLVAPVTVEKGAYVAAGSTITSDVPAGALGVARAKQSNLEGWVERKGYTKKKK